MPENEDEEISIDFSKIKNFFRKKQKDDVQEVEKKAEEVKQDIEQTQKISSEPILQKNEQRVEQIQKEAEKQETKAEQLDQKKEEFEQKLDKQSDSLQKVEDDTKKEDEISFDFSKIKSFFKKSEKDKVTQVEKKAEIVKEEVMQKQRDAPSQQLKEDKKEVETIQKDLKKEEKTAAVIDTETAKIEKKVQTQHKQLNEIEEKDEEVSIDFSKIKNFFSKKSTKKEVEDKDEEISIDFSKIKNIFKKSEAKESDEESFDASKVIGFVKKHYIVFLILIPLLLSVYLRSIPASLPITDNWAESTVNNNIRQQIAGEINAQYPNLPPANRDNLINQRFQQFLSENKNQLDPQIDQVSQQFKSRLQVDGQTYLIAIDPYFWMRKAKNILERGHPGDELRNKITREPCEVRSAECVPWNTHMFAPLGRAVARDMFHGYVVAYTHKVLSMFNSNRQLMSSAFVVPIILSSICVIPAFFIARRIGGNFGGFVAAIIVAVHPAFLTRTVGGFSDTDPYNVLFPLFITWAFLEAFWSKGRIKGIVLSAIAGLIVSIYSQSWGGWWYILDFLLASIIGYTVVYIIINRNNLKNLWKHETLQQTITVFLAFFLSALIFTTLISGFSTFTHAFKGPGNFAKLKEVGIDSVWPNVYTTVAEQNAASLNSVISQIGTGRVLLFLLAVLGIILTLVKPTLDDKSDMYFAIGTIVWLSIILAIRPTNLIWFLVLIALPIGIKFIITIINKDVKVDIKLAIILIIWFCSTLYASTKGVRFLLLLVPAFAIGVGMALGLIQKFLSRFVSKNFDINIKVTNVIIMLLLLLLLFEPAQAAQRTASQEIPSMNDAWYTSLDRIRQQSLPNAIINSWWDFGHWFKSIGDRAVTFDGTSQNTPMAHWIGYTLLTNNESEAIGILRMLDCGSNNAFTELDKQVKDTAHSVEILHEIVAMDQTNARARLLEEVDEQTADNVLQFTHCDNPPENFYITSDDMIGKSGVWAHFGSWNFDRALMYNRLKSSEYQNDKVKSSDWLMERFDMSQEDADKRYFEIDGIRTSDRANTWIAPWPSYASSVVGCQNGPNNTIACPVNAGGQGQVIIQIDLEERQGRIQTPQGFSYPNAIVFPTSNGIEKTTYTNNTIGASMTLIPQGSNWAYVMSAPPLEDSMFTLMFFLEGVGLKQFKKFSDERSFTGNRIIVWKVNWTGEQPNTIAVPALQPPPQAQEEVVEEIPQQEDSPQEEETQEVTQEQAQDVPQDEMQNETMDNQSESPEEIVVIENVTTHNNTPEVDSLNESMEPLNNSNSSQ